MNTQVELNQLQTFYESIKGEVGSGKRMFQLCIEDVESNVHWRNTKYKVLEEWLQKEKLTGSLAARAQHAIPTLDAAASPISKIDY